MILLFPSLLSLPAAVSVQALYDVVRPFEPGRSGISPARRRSMRSRSRVDVHESE